MVTTVKKLVLAEAFAPAIVSCDTAFTTDSAAPAPAFSGHTRSNFRSQKEEGTSVTINVRGLVETPRCVTASRTTRSPPVL